MNFSIDLSFTLPLGARSEERATSGGDAETWAEQRAGPFRIDETDVRRIIHCSEI